MDKPQELMCSGCGSPSKLQIHHDSYEPEITRILCVNCHVSVHNHGVGRPIGYIYTRRGHVPGKRVPYRYRVRKAGGRSRSFEVTIPNEAFMNTVNRYEMTREEGVNKLEAVWRYGAFEGLHLKFEPVKDSG